MIVTAAIRAVAIGTGAAIAAVAGDTVIGPDSRVPLGSAVAVGVAVAAWTWWLSGEFRAIRDRDATVKERLESADKLAGERHQALQRQLDRLPCQAGQKCAK